MVIWEQILHDSPHLKEYPNLSIQSIYQDLRKMYTVVSIRQGSTAKEVQQYLGHSDVKITLIFYDRVLKSTKKGTAAKLDNFRLSM
jgi:integrase